VKKRKRFAIVGAGPKAAAICLKIKVLQDLGYETPEVVVFEKREKAATWTGRNGFTNGNLLF
jgi:mycobactin lysine-N-oxygenase